ncbi:hypothetical protein DV515_00017354, partial [Chloebia gouldiae]
SQKIFAFEWENPKTGQKNQLTGIQELKNFPTIFGEQLAKDLESWEPPPGEGQLLQYVDDLLIATQTQETCVDWTGYRVSQKKAQMVRQTVIYLGYEVSAGQRTLGQDRKEAICQTPRPQTAKELRTFLGMMGGGMGEPVIYDCLETIEDTYSSCPDLKDIPLEASQKIFAFEWENPKTGQKNQLTGIQELKNFPTIFGEQLAKDLESWEPPPGEGQLLQYVDDLLIATQTQETCVDWTGYRVSQKKAQMVRQTVIYLGYEVSAGQRTLGQDRKEAICQTPRPQTAKELRTFLGMMGGGMGEPVIYDCLETIEDTYSSCPDLKDIPLE